MIKLENVTKLYKEGDKPAVKDLSFALPEGEVCVLVGPSGCGKTTTMKMINRLIEPTGGRIFIQDEDIMHKDPIRLRLNIGYVIQEIGLFPHMTIADNIATVPRELKWPRRKIMERVDELLGTVGLDPEQYRQRRPSDLSGGQRQRVGVARALAADPPIMLMDEPFGALDPITRAHLQNEFLRIQEKIRKTIIFVTHDIDEAIKMGDKIAVMREGELIQYASPEELLSSPADDFVVNLVGGNYSIKRLHLVRVYKVLDDKLFAVSPGDPVKKAGELLKKSTIGIVPVIDGDNRLAGLIMPGSLKKRGTAVEEIMEPPGETVEQGATLNDALSVMLNNGVGYVLVADEKNRLLGVVTLNAILEETRSDG